MALTDELRKLEDLHRNGALTDAEYAAAKAVVITGSHAAGAEAMRTAAGAGLGCPDRIRAQLERLDREWELRRASLLEYRRSDVGRPPSKSAGVILLLLSIAFGALSLSFEAAMADRGGPVLLLFLMPAVLSVTGVVMVARAVRYERELADHLRRRGKLEAQLSPVSGPPDGDPAKTRPPEGFPLPKP